MAAGSRSIARKALTLGVAPALCVLISVSATFFVVGLLLAHRGLARDMDALAAVVRDNVSASLAFNDRDTATEIVSALRAKRNIAGICVFDVDGRLFATYVTANFRCEPAAPEEVNVRRDRLVRVAPVTVGNRRVGLVQLVGNYSDLYDWLTVQLLVTAAALGLGSAIAFVLARRMQRTISQPILDLAAAARQVTATGDYSVRARKTSDDEVGALADAINTMLHQIQHHSRLKDEFLAVLSHELRTPLNAILGWLQIVRSKKPEGERLDRALAILDRNARAQARLVEDLLDVSRMVTGRLEMTRGPVDLRDVIAAALDSVAHVITETGVHVTTRLPDASCLVSGDRDRLYQVVANVLSNAVKFTHSGGSVSVDLTPQGENFAITVADTGIGIAPEFLPHVFDRFRQSDASATREHGGLGLGLAIAKELTELHGGSVIAGSAGIGQGATFIIRLPKLAAEPKTGKLQSAGGYHPV